MAPYTGRAIPLINAFSSSSNEDRHPNAAAGAVENGVAADWVLAFNRAAVDGPADMMPRMSGDKFVAAWVRWDDDRLGLAGLATLAWG